MQRRGKTFRHKKRGGLRESNWDGQRLERGQKNSNCQLTLLEQGEEVLQSLRITFTITYFLLLIYSVENMDLCSIPIVPRGNNDRFISILMRRVLGT